MKTRKKPKPAKARKSKRASSSKPKKGVMPPGLAAYLARKRASSSPEISTPKKRAKRKPQGAPSSSPAVSTSISAEGSAFFL